MSYFELTLNTGVELLTVVMDAMDSHRIICFDYASYYDKEKIYHYELIPCFVRLFEHRRYVVCEFLDRSETRVLAPLSLREEVKRELSEMPGRYKERSN